MINTLVGSTTNARLENSAAAKYIGRSSSWLNKERAAGRGPRFLKLGGRVAYRIADLDEYLQGRLRETTDTRGAA